MVRSRSTIAVVCGLMLAACGSGGAPDPAAGGDPTMAGFEVHSTPEATAAAAAMPRRRSAGCIPVRQDDANGERNCVPRAEVCKRGAIWWTRDLPRVCSALKPLPVRIVSAPEELPVGATMCVVWAGTPSKVREGVLVVSSAHANCVTGLVGSVAGPPAEPLATVFPARRPDCGKYYPGTRRAWTAKVSFVDPPGQAWACLIG